MAAGRRSPPSSDDALPSPALPGGASEDVGALDEDAHAVLARLRATEPVSWVPALEGWLVTGYDESVAVMRDSHGLHHPGPRLSTARVAGHSTLSMDGAEYTLHRSPFVAPFPSGPGAGPVRRRGPAAGVLAAGAIVVMLAVVALGVVLGMGTLETLRTAQESSDGSAGDGPVAD